MMAFASIRELFDQIAVRYDLMNDIMTCGLHRRWKRSAIEHLAIDAVTQPAVLDLATGTGDLPLLLNDMYHGQVDIIGIDFSQCMLDVAVQRSAKHHKINFVHGDILSLPFPDRSFDGVTIAFGLRNVSDYRACLGEALRVCRPQGKLVILDMSYPSPVMHVLSWVYRFLLVPLLGALVAQNRTAYAYLPNSVYNYLDQKQLLQLMSDVGWSDVQYRNICGGVIAIHHGRKP